MPTPKLPLFDPVANAYVSRVTVPGDYFVDKSQFNASGWVLIGGTVSGDAGDVTIQPFTQCAGVKKSDGAALVISSGSSDFFDDQFDLVGARGLTITGVSATRPIDVEVSQ